MAAPLDFISVLIADGHHAMRKIIRGLLEQAGIKHIFEAENGRDAFDWLCDDKLPLPDVIICELHMDGMDGMKLCNEVRLGKGVRESHIPILILTGERDPMVIEVARQTGAAAVLQKPISSADLGKEVAKAIGFAG